MNVEYSCPLCRFIPDDDEFDFLRFRRMGQMWISAKKGGEDRFKYFVTILQNSSESKLENLIDAPEFIPTIVA